MNSPRLITRNIHAARFHWAVGTLFALIGVVTARIIAPTLASRPQAFVAVAGQLFALLGLFIILLGVRRRLRCDGQAPSSADDA